MLALTPAYSDWTADIPCTYWLLKTGRAGNALRRKSQRETRPRLVQIDERYLFCAKLLIQVAFAATLRCPPLKGQTATAILPEVTGAVNWMSNASARMNLQIGKEWRPSRSESRDDERWRMKYNICASTSSRGWGKEQGLLGFFFDDVQGSGLIPFLRKTVNQDTRSSSPRLIVNAASRFKMAQKCGTIAGVGVHARLLRTLSHHHTTRKKPGEMAATRSPSLHVLEAARASSSVTY